MRDKNKLKAFLVLAFSTLFIFSFSQIGASAYTNLFRGGTVKQGTMIASNDISCLTKQGAEQKLNEEIERWKNETSILLTMDMDKQVVLDSSIFQFNVKSSIEQNNGNLIVTINENALKTFLNDQFHSTILTILDIPSFNQQLIIIASSLETGVFEVVLDEYILQDQLPKTMISESKIGLDNQNSNKLKDKLQSAVIQPGQTFSLQSYLDENQLDALENGFLNRMATAIYTAILPTNLQIIERHISSELPEYAELGKEANFKANQRDLIFFNPDSSDVEVTFLVTTEMLSVQIKGITTQDQYKVVVENEKAFSAKTIIQYDSSLPELGKKVVNEGKKGQSVTVKRLLVQNDTSQNEIVLSEDFYAPIHRVEKHGLKTESSNPTNEPEGNTVDENGHFILSPTIGNPKQSSNVTPDVHNQGGMNEDLLPSSSTFEENNADRLWEKPKVLK